MTHHEPRPAFQKFLRAARYPSAQRVTIRGREVQVDGAILVWGAVTGPGRGAVIEHYGLTDVLAIREPACRPGRLAAGLLVRVGAGPGAVDR